MTILILAVLVGACAKLAYKRASHEASAYSVAILTQIVGTAVSLAVVAARPPETFAIPPHAWVPLACASAVWSALSVMLYIGIRHTEVSVRESLLQSRTLFAFIISLVVFRVAATPQAFLGAVLVMLGVAMAALRAPRGESSNTLYGISTVVLGALLAAVAAVFDKMVVSVIDPYYYSAIVFSVPGVVLSAFLTTRRRAALYHLVTERRRGLTTITVAAALGSIAYLLQLHAYQLFDLHIAYPILQFSSVLAIMGAMLFLGERERMRQKLLGFMVALAGAVLLKLGA